MTLNISGMKRLFNQLLGLDMAPLEGKIRPQDLIKITEN
jgi:hypothetical protein